MRSDAAMQSAIVPSTDLTVTEPILPLADPWGLLVVGASTGTNPLCAEASRLGFEVFRTRTLSADDRDRLRATDWIAAVIVDASDLADSVALLGSHLDPDVPIVWVGGTPFAADSRPVTHLSFECPPEQIAATVFDRAAPLSISAGPGDRDPVGASSR